MPGLMLDEMISPSIVARFWEAGVDAICARDRGLLSASDSRLWQYAQAEKRTVVTGNIAHFERLAKKAATHYGVITIPEGGNRDLQFQRAMLGVNWASSMGEDAMVDMVVYVHENRLVVGRILTANNDNVLARTSICTKVGVTPH